MIRTLALAAGLVGLSVAAGVGAAAGALAFATAGHADVVTYHRLGSAIVGDDGSSTRRLGSATIHEPPPGSGAPRIICRPLGSGQTCEEER